jgi:hypothetical protein
LEGKIFADFTTQCHSPHRIEIWRLALVLLRKPPDKRYHAWLWKTFDSFRIRPGNAKSDDSHVGFTFSS